MQNQPYFPLMKQFEDPEARLPQQRCPTAKQSERLSSHINMFCFFPSPDVFDIY